MFFFHTKRLFDSLLTWLTQLDRESGPTLLMHTSACFFPKTYKKYPSTTRPEPRNLAYGRLATPTHTRSTRQRLTANAMGLGLTTARCLSAKDQTLDETKGWRRNEPHTIFSQVPDKSTKVT